MLKPKLFPKVLEQANTDGVVCTMVTTPEGAIIAYAGDKNEKEVAAISASVFAAYDKMAKSLGEEIEFFVLNNENGKVAVARIARFLLCMMTKDNVELGILKSKAKVMGDYLAEWLSQVAAPN